MEFFKHPFGLCAVIALPGGTKTYVNRIPSIQAPPVMGLFMHAKEIRRLIATHARLSVHVDQLTDDCDLYDAGLTSLTTVNLMLALEDRFNVEFTDAMLRRKTFSSIRSLSEAIEALSAVESTTSQG